MVIGIGRRQFISALGGATVAWPLAAWAQTQRSARIGYIGAWYSPSAGEILLDSFRHGMREYGYVEGQNLTIDFRWLEGKATVSDEAAHAAAELIRSNIDVLAVQGPAMAGVIAETRSFPIVMVYSGDPVEAKLVTSFARPGGNITGISLLAPDLAGKQLDLLKQAMPGLSRVAVLVNPQHPGDDAEFRTSHGAAERLGLTLEYAPVRTVTEVNTTLDAMSRDRVQALLAFPSLLIYSQRKEIAEFAAKKLIPTMSGWKDFAVAGNLMTYGPDLDEAWRIAATYVAKILKGSKPADLPVQLPTRYELAINLKTAKALGRNIPPTLIAITDEVIE
jgi:putative ABC transport system substrate-binding protein